MSKTSRIERFKTVDAEVTAINKAVDTLFASEGKLNEMGSQGMSDPSMSLWSNLAREGYGSPMSEQAIREFEEDPCFLLSFLLAEQLKKLALDFVSMKGLTILLRGSTAQICISGEVSLDALRTEIEAYQNEMSTPPRSKCNS